jgi:SNF2 family DNA or RNA helicase
MSGLVVRVNAFLESRGFTVLRLGLADREVQRELERRRSFARTSEAAAQWKSGDSIIDIGEVKRRLRDFGWTEMRVLRPHQEQGIAHALCSINAANFSVPGSGKTIVALAVAASHLINNSVNLILVIGPLSCFRPWEEEAAAALGSKLPTRRIRGSARVRQIAYDTAEPGNLLLTSFAAAAADKSALIQLCKKYDLLIIVDESHRIKRFQGGIWAPALMQIAAYARIRIILSGTPMPQGGRDLYSQLNVLWPGSELTGSRDRFAVRVDTDLDSLLRAINPFIARTPKSVLGLTPYSIVRHEVPLKGLQAEVYDLIVSGIRDRLDDATTWSDKLDALRRARPIRLLQAAANPGLLNRNDKYYGLKEINTVNPTLMDRLATYADREVPAKSEAALAILAEIVTQGGKAVCWSNFIANLDSFASLVRHSIGVPCFQIDGRLPTGDEPADDFPDAAPTNTDDLDTRERVIERFLATNGPAVLVTNPASCSESISLHRGCHHAIYLDRTYDCAQFLQSIDRVHRLGLPSDTIVKIHIMLATNGGAPTVDHLVDSSLLSKEALMRELLEGAELRPLAQSAEPTQDAEGTSQDLAALLGYLIGLEQTDPGE